MQYLVSEIKLTKRVARLCLCAEHASEELLLTNLVEAMKEGTLDAFIVTLKDGKTFELTMDP